MAILIGDNTKLYAGFPKLKIAPNEINNQLDCLTEEITLTAELAANDEILGPILPEGCKVIDAMVRIPASLGGGGILTLGHKAGVDLDGNAIGEDDNSFVTNADAGGQAVLERSGPDSVGIHLKPGKGGLQTFLKCTEASTAGVGVKISYSITYMKR